LIATTVATVLLGYLCLISTAFVIVYGLFVTHRTPSGTHLLAFAAVVAAIAGEEFAMRIWGRYDGHEAVIAVLIAAAAALMTWRLVRLWQTSFDARRARRTSTSRPHSRS